MTELLHHLEEKVQHMHHHYKWTEVYLVVAITIIGILQVIEMTK